MYLCIDTTTEDSGVAIVGDGDCSYLPLNRSRASDSILEKIDQLVKKTSIRLFDVKGVFAVKGPGSFTGLRVGIAVANQFAHQLGIPIIGILADELYSCKIREKDFFYLQSMNRDQIYMVGYGKYKTDHPMQIISVSECHHELASVSGAVWFGQLSEAHRNEFIGIKEVSDIASPEKTWLKVSADNFFVSGKKYSLVEPHYGKQPTITVGKKHMQ